MFCPNCGNKVKDGSLFCGECGTSLKEYWEDMAPDGGEQESFDGFSQADDLDDISVKMSETAGLSDPEDEIPADRIRVNRFTKTTGNLSMKTIRGRFMEIARSLFMKIRVSRMGITAGIMAEIRRGSPMGTEMQVSHTVARVRRMVRKLRIILHGRNRKNR